MMNVKLLAALLLICLSAAAPVRAQSPLVYVESNLSDAVLMADTVLVGSVIAQPFTLQPGAHRLTLMPPAAKGWSVKPLSRQVALRMGDTLRIAMPFPHYYRVESVPSEAGVYHLYRGDRTLLGQTPLLHVQPQPLRGEIKVSAPGHLSESVTAAEAVWNPYLLYLEPLDELLDEPQSAQIAWQPPRAPDYWIDVAAGVVAVAATALSVHYKFKADDLFDEYARTGNPALIPEYEAYDRRALISLGVGQVGLGVLAVRFALR